MTITNIIKIVEEKTQTIWDSMLEFQECQSQDRSDIEKLQKEVRKLREDVNNISQNILDLVHVIKNLEQPND